MKRFTFALLAVAACSKAPPLEQQQNKGPELTEVDVGAALPVDHPVITPPGDGTTSASARRFSVQQLRNSFPVAMGTDSSGNQISWYMGAKLGLDTMASALGEADYINITADNLEPSPLYLKFMDDAARDVCNRALTADYSGRAINQRVLLRFAGLADTVASNKAAIDDNLRYLKLRFFAEKVDAADDAAISDLRTLFDTAVKSAAGSNPPSQANVKEGWRSVCVALVTSPEFHLY